MLPRFVIKLMGKICVKGFLPKVLPYCLLTCALPTSTALAQYQFDVWNTDNGLPQNSVQVILQTRDGYLWFTTFDGLVRYDGVRFTVFNTANSKGITSNRFIALFEDRDGILWVGTEDGGLIKYQAGTFTTYTTEDGLLHNRVTAIQDDAEGNLLVSTSAGLVRRQNGKFIPLIRKEVGPYPNADYRDRAGAIWYFDQARLYRLKDGQVITYQIEGELVKAGTISMREDRQGSLWIGTYAGLNRLKDGTLTVYTMKDGLPKGYVRTIYEDRRGNLWLGSTEGGLSRFKDGRFTTYSMAHGLSSNNVSAIYEDREGTLWVGTHDGGLNRLRKQVIDILDQQDGLAANNAYPVYEDRAGVIWIGTWERGLNRYENGRVTHYSAKDGLPGNLVLSLAEDREGRLWVGAINGVSWFKDGRFSFANRMVFPPSIGVNAVWSIHEDRAGSLWFGTDKGLFRYKDGTATLYTTGDGLAGNEVKVIIEDRQGALWIGTYGGLTRFAGGKFFSYTKQDGLASNRVRALYEDREGVLWVGTYDGGLSRFKDGRIISYTTADGLFNNGVFQILEDDQGNFWMSCNVGIYRVSRGQLNDFAAGKIQAITSISFGKSDGLLNPECNGGSQPAGVRTRDGKLWFPTQGGVAVIDPKDIPFNFQPPPVVIERFILDREVIDLHPSVEIAPGRENVEIQYTGLSFIKPEHIRFKYRLRGLDEEWVEAGTRRAAYYSHLPPGEYIFNVIAANSDGVWNTEGAQLRIVVHPPFWRTWWFISLATLAVVGTAILVYERRLVRLRRAHQAQEAFSRQLIESQEGERKRIAAELHDGLCQSLVIIKNRALLSLNTPDDPDSAFEQLDEIATAATQAIDEAKEIAYNLRPFQLDRLGLTKAIETMLGKVSGSHGLRLSARLDSIDNLLPKEAEINLYRIVQEGVNNIVKHAEASEAQVEIKRDARRVEITIQDDGRGFAPEAISVGEESHRGGFGLVGIRERARILDADLIVNSAPGRGTIITIKIDLKDNHDGN
jgi:ligand-binding sensor domain-containing protein/signal transduction histidine kinase